MIKYFTGVYIINRILNHGLEIKNFSSRVQKHFTHSLFQHSKRNFVSPHGHVISSINHLLSAAAQGLRHCQHLNSAKMILLDHCVSMWQLQTLDVLPYSFHDLKISPKQPYFQKRKIINPLTPRRELK